MAVLEKRAGLLLQNQDAYLKAAGGVKLDEPAIDLKKISDGLGTSTSPPSRISNTPISLVEPKRFLTTFTLRPIWAVFYKISKT